MRIITARPHRLLDVCIDRIGRLAAEGKRCMLLVPSQYTLQAEIEMMTRLNLNGSFLIDVLSPVRLRSRVFECAGAPDRTIIDTRGKCMMISSILEQEKEHLTVYHSSGHGQMGISEKLSAVIADLKRSAVTPTMLESFMAEMNLSEAGRNKLKDICRIYGVYEERMCGRLADEEDVAREVRDRMARSGIFAGQHVFIYGFDVITQGFAEDIIQMGTLADSLSVAVETDANSAPDGRLFAPVNLSIERMAALAAEKGIRVERERLDIELKTPLDIRLVEKELFALGRKAACHLPECIEVSAHGTPRAEVHAAASQIRRLISEGMDPVDMAVVYPKGSGYGALIESILPMYELNAYVAEKRQASSNPLCRFLISALSVISGGWRTGDVIEYIQSGFLPLKRIEIDAICSYAEGIDLRAEAWKRPFDYIKTGTKDMLDALNQTREIIVEPLKNLSSRIVTAKNADMTIAAVIALLEEVGAYERLESMRRELKDQGYEALAEDCAQVWNKVMETLNQLHTLLGGESVSAGNVLLLLESGISAMELSALPPADGAVICGEIGNVRTAQIKMLFAIGMNDSADSAQQGLLSQNEIEETERATKAYLGMTASQRAALAQLDILKTLSGTKEKLFVSYALADETGRALREGVAITALRELFPKVQVHGGMAHDDLLSMFSAPKPAALALSVMLSDAADNKKSPSDEAAQVYAALVRSEESRDQLMRMTQKLSSPVRPKLDGAQARRLYGRPVMSVSRLETFAQCPYKHFVRYGLSPEEEIKPGVDRAEVGTLYHEAAEKFTRAIAKRPEFPDVEGAICDSVMSEAIGPLIEQWRQSPLGQSSRGAAIAGKIEKTARRAGRNIVSQYAGGSFKPMRSELIFGQGDLAPITLELADGSMIYLQGRIDRVDVMENGKIRIIDYKSGAKKFDPTMAYWGLQLQLMIYLTAALARIPQSGAAGFFYCRIADPTVRSESRIKEEVEKQLAKKLALTGISLSEVEILRAHGQSHAAMITKDGKASGRYASSMVNEEEMRRLLDFASEKAVALAQDAYGGVIDDAPAEVGQFVACASCGYAAVCGFDPSRKKSKRLAGKKLSDLIGGEND